MMKVPRHTHRFGERVVRYDKENGRCVIKRVLKDHEATFQDITELATKEYVEDMANFIESTAYFAQLDESRS